MNSFNLMDEHRRHNWMAEEMKRHSLPSMVEAIDEENRLRLISASSGLDDLRYSAFQAEHLIKAAGQAQRLANLGMPDRVQHSFGRSADEIYEEIACITQSARTSALLRGAINLSDYAEAISSVAVNAYHDALGDLGMRDTIGEHLRAGVLSGLQLSALAKYRSPIDRVEWMSDLAPTIGRLAALTESTISRGAFDSLTLDLLDDAIGPSSPEFDSALCRAKSLRVRRALYRENGADSSIDLVPFPVVKASLAAPAQEPPQQAEDTDRVRLFALLIADSPLTEEHQSCYRIAFHLETYLRRHVNWVMKDKYGSEWFQEPYLKPMRASCVRRFKKKHGAFAEPTPAALLGSSVLNDLIEIVMHEYGNLVDDHPALLRNLRVVQEVRNDTTHFYAIVPLDVIRIENAALAVVGALRRIDDEAGNRLH